MPVAARDKAVLSPFDKLRACPVLDTGANVVRADKMIVNRL